MKLPLATRPYDAKTDSGFLYTAWINSFRRSEYAGVVPEHIFFDITRIAINQLLARGMTVTMAVSPEDRDQIIGFIAYEPQVVHYLFVKDVFRRSGVANYLKACANFDPERPVFCTFKTSSTRYLGDLVHRPGLARRKDLDV